MTAMIKGIDFNKAIADNCAEIDEGNLGRVFNYTSMLLEVQRAEQRARTKLAQKDNPFRCAFCGKTKEESRKMVCSSSIYLCDECIDLCHEVVHSEADMVEAVRK